MGWEEHPFAVVVMLLMGWYSLCTVHRPTDEAGLTRLLEEGGSRDILRNRSSQNVIGCSFLCLKLTSPFLFLLFGGQPPSQTAEPG